MDNMPGGSDRAAKPRTPKEAVSLGPVLQGELAEIKKVRLKRMPENHGNCGVGRPREPAPAPEVPLPEVEPAPEWQTRDKEWVKATEDAHAANRSRVAEFEVRRSIWARSRHWRNSSCFPGSIISRRFREVDTSEGGWPRGPNAGAVSHRCKTGWRQTACTRKTTTNRGRSDFCACLAIT